MPMEIATLSTVSNFIKWLTSCTFVHSFVIVMFCSLHFGLCSIPEN